MSDYTTLLGAEDVSRAGSRMAAAAEEFGRHVGYMDESLRRHQQFLDEWLLRFQEAIAAAQPAAVQPTYCTCENLAPRVGPPQYSSLCPVHGNEAQPTPEAE